VSESDDPLTLSSGDCERKSLRTALGSVHVHHGMLHGMHLVALDTAHSFDRRHMTAVGGEGRKEAGVDGHVSVK
jgi:hypothetical protein